MERKKLMHRIARLQGQLESLKKLLEQDTPCEEVLRQSKTCKMAMESFSKAFLVSMMTECFLSAEKSKVTKHEMSEMLEVAIKNL